MSNQITKLSWLNKKNVTLNSTDVFDGSKVISYQDLGQIKFKI